VLRRERDHPAFGSPWSRRGQCWTGYRGGVTGSSERGGGYFPGHQEGLPEERALQLCLADGYGLYRQ